MPQGARYAPGVVTAVSHTCRYRPPPSYLQGNGGGSGGGGSGGGGGGGACARAGGVSVFHGRAEGLLLANTHHHPSGCVPSTNTASTLSPPKLIHEALRK